jgi:replicative DNA helicase
LKGFADSHPALQDVGGSNYLIDLVDMAPFCGDIMEYACCLKDLFIRREIIRIAKETVDGLLKVEPDDPAIGYVESLEKSLYSLATKGNARDGFKTFAQTIQESIAMADIAYHHKSGVVGVTSGFRELDDQLGGLLRSDLLILAGRPSMGKTALVTNIAFNAAKAFRDGDSGGGRVGFFSLEMSAEQLTTRILSQETRYRSDMIRKGKLDYGSVKHFSQLAKELDTIPLFIDDTPALSVAALRTRSRRLMRQHGLDLIIIDYLQLLMPNTNKRSENRVQEVSDITRALKALAKELNVPVIALSQLSRAVEQREDKKPQLSDLRESGSIEQDADVVMFVYRDEYYTSRKKGGKPEEKPAEENPVKNSSQGHNAEIIIAKQRHGPIGTVNLLYFPHFTSFRSPSNMVLEERGPSK